MEKHYHGSNSTAATLIQCGKIDWHLGGGELGKGFYTTPDIWVASKASWNSENGSVSVVEIKIEKSDSHKLNQEVFNLYYARRERRNIKKKGAQRTFVYDFFDVIESPIAGAYRYNKNLQHKWQSDASVALLNSKKVLRKIR